MSLKNLVFVCAAGLLVCADSSCLAESGGTSTQSMLPKSGTNPQSPPNATSKLSQSNSSGTSLTASSSTASQSDTAQTSAQPTKRKHSFWRCLPVRVLGVGTGMLGGYPVNMVRKPIDEEKYYINDLTGDYKQGRTVAPASIFAAPFALVAGVLEAPFYAIDNALVNFAKPFSKEQVSLGKTANQGVESPAGADTSR